MTLPAASGAHSDLVARFLNIVRSHVPEDVFSKYAGTHHPISGAAYAEEGDVPAAMLWALNKAIDDPRIRRGIASSIATQERALLRDDLAANTETQPNAAAADGGALHSDGLLMLGQMLDAGELAAIRQHFDGCVASHRDPTLLNYEIADVLRAPHLLRIALDPRILAAASAHLEMPATIVDVSAWISEPGGSEPEGPQIFHRDRDDFRACKLFVYLTDVGPDDGPHIFVRHSHDFDWILNQLGGEPGLVKALALFAGNGRHIAALIDRMFGPNVTEITGPAGTSFLELTYGFHRGKVPTGRARLVFQVMYAMTPFPVRTTRLSAAPPVVLPEGIADTPSTRHALRFFPS